MEPIQIPKRSVPDASAGVLSFFPKMHILIAGGLVSALVGMTSLPSERAEAHRQTFSLELPKLEPSAPAADLTWTELELEKPSHRQVELTVQRGDTLSALFQRAGFSDRRLATLLDTTGDAVRKHRHALNIRPVYKRVDTCAAEFATRGVSAATGSGSSRKAGTSALFAGACATRWSRSRPGTFCNLSG